MKSPKWLDLNNNNNNKITKVHSNKKVVVNLNKK